MGNIIGLFDFLLRRVAEIKDEKRIDNFLEAIRNRYIRKFEFFGVSPNSRIARFCFSIEIDWNSQSISPCISFKTSWGNEEKIDPELPHIAREFLERCSHENLKIEWCLVYSDYVNTDELNKKLGTTRSLTTEELKNITPPNGDFTTFSALGIEELKIKHTWDNEEEDD